MTATTKLVSLGGVWLAVMAAPLAAQWTAIKLHSDSEFGYSRVFAVTPTSQFGVASLFAPNEGYKPIRWNSSSQNWSNFAQGTQLLGIVYGAAGAQQVGHLNLRASLWEGASQSRIELHVPGNVTSIALAIDGQEQVGVMESPAFQARATLWRGSAESAVDLHPPGAEYSRAFAVSGGRQGGSYRIPGPSSSDRAALWSGTAQSMVNLHPGPTFIDSVVRGMSADHQVGSARAFGQDDHAAMWRGTAQSWIDMDPPGSGISRLFATCGSAQVGDAFVGLAGGGAGIWFGTRESFTPLAPYLPAGYQESIATSVAYADGLYYVGGYAFRSKDGTPHAFMWVGVPAPGTLAPFLLAAGLAARRRRADREASI